MNIVSYATSMSGMDTFLYLVLIIATSMIIYVEDKSNTWKNLITTPKAKKQLLATKMGIALKQNLDVTGITVTILLIMCCEMVADIVPKPLSNILPFSYLAKATSVAIETMMPMVIVLSCYSIILWGIYLMKFKRQL